MSIQSRVRVSKSTMTGFVLSAGTHQMVCNLQLIAEAVESLDYQIIRCHIEMRLSMIFEFRGEHILLSLHLQRDLAFDKLKHYHQTTHQTVPQYYTTMINKIVH